eukprot:15248465-Alexandrium_andersonii.AAC.1
MCIRDRLWKREHGANRQRCCVTGGLCATRVFFTAQPPQAVIKECHKTGRAPAIVSDAGEDVAINK